MKEKRVPSFLVYMEQYLPNGTEMRVVQLYGLTAEEQLAAFNRAIVGYDPYHPDAPEAPEFKFSVPSKSPVPPASS